MDLLDTAQLVRTHIHQVTDWCLAHPLETAAGLGAFAGATYLVRGTHARPMTHGSARFATADELRQAGWGARDGVVAGRIPWRHRVVHAPGPGHVGLFGPQGSGKDTRHLWRTTARWPGSMVILDIKHQGENFHHCGAARAHKGPVSVFAPSMRGSASYNPLDYIRWGEPEAFDDVTALVETLMAPTKQREQTHQNAQFFASRGRTVLRAAVLHVGATQASATLSGVLTFLSDRRAALGAMAQSAQAALREVAQEFQGIDSEYAEGVWANALNPLDIFRSPLIAQHTAKSTFDFRTFQRDRRPQTLYLIVQDPGELQRLLPLLRVVLSQGLMLAMRQPERPRWPLLWLLNEFPQWGYMPFFEETAAVVRGYGMRYVVVCQDPGFVLNTYGERSLLWANLQTKLFHTPNSPTTARLISEICGPTTVTWTTTSRGRWGTRPTTTTHQGERPLLDVSEVLRMSPKTVLACREGMAPAWLRKAPVWRG